MVRIVVETNREAGQPHSTTRCRQASTCDSDQARSVACDTDQSALSRPAARARLSRVVKPARIPSIRSSQAARAAGSVSRAASSRTATG